MFSQQFWCQIEKQRRVTWYGQPQLQTCRSENHLSSFEFNSFNLKAFITSAQSPATCSLQCQSHKPCCNIDGSNESRRKAHNSLSYLTIPPRPSLSEFSTAQIWFWFSFESAFIETQTSTTFVVAGFQGVVTLIKITSTSSSVQVFMSLWWLWGILMNF